MNWGHKEGNKDRSRGYCKRGHQGVKAAGVVGEEHDVGFHERDGGVPSIVRLAHEADQLARHLGLRLAQADRL